MHRVQCLDCRHVLAGRRHSYTEYVYCESCCRHKFRRLQAQIDNLRLDALKASRQAKELKLLSQRASFLSSWYQHCSDDQDKIPPFADVTFRLPNGSCVHAHRAFLAGKSPAFKAMFCIPDVQGDSAAKIPVTVDIDDMSCEALRAFVHFFYTASVDSEIMEKHSKLLYHAAEKYEVDLLKTLCEEWITKNLSDQNVLSNLELAKQYKSDVVKDAILHAASSHIGKIPCYADYQAYVERNPRLLLELYEGTVKLLGQKRKRKGKFRKTNLELLVSQGLLSEFLLTNKLTLPNRFNWRVSTLNSFTAIRAWGY